MRVPSFPSLFTFPSSLFPFPSFPSPFTLYLLPLFLLFFPFLLSAQEVVTRKTADGKVQKWYKKAMEESRAGDDSKALDLLGKCLEREPAFIDGHIQAGAILYDRGDEAGAERFFAKAAELQPDYNTKLWYTLGIISWKEEDYTEAAKRFERYLELEEKNEILLGKAEKYLADSRFAAHAVENPVPFEPVSLGPNVNSPNPEYLPTLTADGSTLIFTRVVPGRPYRHEDFYYARWGDTAWLPAQPLESLNTPYNEGAQSISADGRLLAFTGCDRAGGYGSCDIYLARQEKGRWSKPYNAGPRVNTGAWESQPSLGANGQTLYFTSSRNGGLGGKDLWVSFLQEDGSWGTPQNLGAPVNTPWDEQSPFIHADDQTLYFESEGHPGMGGHDLFRSRRQSDGSWSEPMNLGYPINTRANEGALSIGLQGGKAYFATDRRRFSADAQSVFDDPLAGTETDLYRFELYEEARPEPATYLQARVFSAETRLPIQGALAQLDDLSQDQQVAGVRTGEEGDFLLCLPSGRNYALHVSAPGHLFHSEHFALEGIYSFEEPYRLRIYLQPLPADLPKAEPGKPVVLRNVFFASGSAELLPASLRELNRLRDLLNAHPDMRIQLRGHTDNVGTEADNQALSEARARAVYDYLISQGIAPERLQYKGFGESQPVATNETPAGRQENRRTEFVVMGKG